MKFAHEAYSVRAPFAVYADFEALVQPSERTRAESGHNSFEYESQVPCSVGYKIISTFRQFDKPNESHVSLDSVKWFIDEKKQFEKRAMDFYYDEKRMVLNPSAAVEHHFATNCWICKEPFNPALNDKVADHDHATGKYRGAAHSQCNLRLRRTCKIPIFFHNFRGYDGHFITQALKHYTGEKINVIGQGMEKYLTLSLGKYLVFKDTLQFLSFSLQTLADNMSKGGIEKFKHLKLQFPNTRDDLLKLLIRKGVYPYEYMDSMARFDEKQLPPKAAFFSKLTNSDIAEEDYAHAKKVWEKFNIKSMREYHNHYLKSKSIPSCNFTCWFSIFSFSHFHNWNPDYTSDFCSS